MSTQPGDSGQSGEGCTERHRACQWHNFDISESPSENHAYVPSPIAISTTRAKRSILAIAPSCREYLSCTARLSANLGQVRTYEASPDRLLPAPLTQPRTGTRKERKRRDERHTQHAERIVPRGRVGTFAIVIWVRIHWGIRRERGPKEREPKKRRLSDDY